jgi:hypothetical protein
MASGRPRARTDRSLLHAAYRWGEVTEVGSHHLSRQLGAGASEAQVRQRRRPPSLLQDVAACSNPSSPPWKPAEGAGSMASVAGSGREGDGLPASVRS